MATQKLTKRLIDDTKPSEREQILWDSEVRGLGLKVTPSGAKTFVLFYRTLDGTQRKPKVGSYGSITLDQAREISRDMLAEVRGGKDPSNARKASRQAPTVADLCERFTAEHTALRKPATQEQYAWLVNSYIKPLLGSRKVSSVDHEDVARVVRSVGTKYPIAANRLRTVLRKMFSLSEKWGLRPAGSNPCTHVERYKEIKRHRDLKPDEMARLAVAMDDEEGADPRAVAAIRLLMLTGCRKNEIVKLRWSEVALERGLLRLTDSKTGAKEVFLNQPAREIIERQEKVEGNPYVFASRVTPKAHITTIRYAWARVLEAAGIDGMRLHDLRHNFASYAAAEGLSLPMIGALLGHKNPATTARYAVLANDPARRASEVVGRALTVGLVEQ